MKITNKLGLFGEEETTKLLLQKGFSVVDRNYSIKNIGEIDIIAINEKLILFIEVKTRKASNIALYDPAFAITNKKIKSISKTSIFYLKEHNNFSHLQPRFDVSLVYVKNNDFDIKYIESAFLPKFE